jgi:signal transduction histidine kinase
MAWARRARYIRRMSSAETRLPEIVDLVRRVRHDANNPLTAALGHVQLLLDDPAVQDAGVRESLQVVDSELRRLIDILRQLNAVRVD